MGGQEAGLKVGAREEIRQRLEREGVPPPVVEYVLKFSLIELSENIIKIVFVLILLISLKSSYLLLNLIENQTLTKLYEVAINMDGIIYIYNFIYPVIFFAPGIFFYLHCARCICDFFVAEAAGARLCQGYHLAHPEPTLAMASASDDSAACA